MHHLWEVIFKKTNIKRVIAGGDEGERGREMGREKERERERIERKIMPPFQNLKLWSQKKTFLIKFHLRKA